MLLYQEILSFYEISWNYIEIIVYASYSVSPCFKGGNELELHCILKRDKVYLIFLPLFVTFQMKIAVRNSKCYQMSCYSYRLISMMRVMRISTVWHCLKLLETLDMPPIIEQTDRLQ